MQSPHHLSITMTNKKETQGIRKWFGNAPFKIKYVAKTKPPPFSKKDNIKRKSCISEGGEWTKFSQKKDEVSSKTT